MKKSKSNCLMSKIPQTSVLYVGAAGEGEVPESVLLSRRCRILDSCAIIAAWLASTVEMSP